jgi:uncharacterized damage-inducible protein DinB
VVLQEGQRMETEIDRIIDELNREYAVDPWHGLPLTEILAGITAPQALARPVAGAHSIFEIVLHMIGWKDEVRRRLSGAPAAEPEQGDWPPVSDRSAQGWRTALDRLDAAHQALLSAVRTIPESQLLAPTNDPREKTTGAGVSYYVLLHGIVQHDVYHSGQIALLKKGVAG